MPVKDTFTSDDDYLVLEDEFGRVPLVIGAENTTLPVHDFVTGSSFFKTSYVDFNQSIETKTKQNKKKGVVVAVLGEEVDGGDFKVYDIIEPGYAPQRKLPGFLFF